MPWVLLPWQLWSSRYAGTAAMCPTLNARKRLIEADILNEAENILYQT